MPNIVTSIVYVCVRACVHCATNVWLLNSSSVCDARKAGIELHCVRCANNSGPKALAYLLSSS